MFFWDSRKFVAVAFLSVLLLLLYWNSKLTAEVNTAQQSENQEFELSPEKRQQVRKLHLKEYCLKHQFNKTPRPEDLSFVFVDDELKLIYCVVPKVATKTWREVIGRARGFTIKRPRRWLMWREFGNYTTEEKSQRLKTYLKFVFVREPLHRLLSAYKDRIVAHAGLYKDLRNEIVKDLRPQDFDANGGTDNSVSFPEFIQYFSDNKTRNQHWRQYEKLCHPCIINYDFIGHFETMEQDAVLLLKMAGIDDRVGFPPIHKSTSSSEVMEYYSQVPAERITRIGEMYRSDFKMFSYEYLGPVKPLLKRSKNDTPV